MKLDEAFEYTYVGPGVVLGPPPLIRLLNVNGTTRSFAHHAGRSHSQTQWSTRFMTCRAVLSSSDGELGASRSGSQVEKELLRGMILGADSAEDTSQ